MLKIQCWDHDTVKNDFMGMVDVPMCDIQTEIKFKSHTGNGYFQRWYQLKPRGKLHIDGTITGDLLLKFEIVGVKQIPTALSRIPSGPVHAGARLVMLLQQSHLDITSLISVGSALKLDTRLKGICISLGALSLLKMHLTYNINSVPVLLGILRILVTMTTLEEAKEKMVELGYMCELYDVVKHHAIDRSTILLYADWTQLLLNLSDYYELKGHIIAPSSLPFFIKLLDSEDAHIQENTLLIIHQHILASSLPFDSLLDSLENMLESSSITVKRLCVKLLVAFSAKEKEKRKLLSLIEPLIKLLGEETMTDDILLTLLNLVDQESVRVFIIEEGNKGNCEKLSCLALTLVSRWDSCFGGYMLLWFSYSKRNHY